MFVDFPDDVAVPFVVETAPVDDDDDDDGVLDLALAPALGLVQSVRHVSHNCITGPATVVSYGSSCRFTAIAIVYIERMIAKRESGKS